MANIIRKIWAATLAPTFYKTRKYFKYNYYCLQQPRIISEIRKKEKKKIVFFVLSVSMWKSNELFRRLLEDPEFDPYVISFLYPQKDDMELMKSEQENIETYFKQLGFPYINCYDFEKNEWFDLKGFSPDVVFYGQPYNHGYKGLLLENIWTKALFAYIPYCVNLESDIVFYNQIYQNICWRMYCPTEYNKVFEGQLLYNKGRNIVVSGHPLFDAMSSFKGDFHSYWKSNNPNLKRVIWAPHHTIEANDRLAYSTFLQIADEMLELAKKYRNVIQFAFKPHPRLKSKLYKHSNWGIARTDAYYNEWAQLSNTILSEGDYVGLFCTSDAMVHDSASFTCEYVFTEKPVMFIEKNNHEEYLNDLGIACYNQHYKGRTINDVEEFLLKTVIGGEDSLREQRCRFKHQSLVVSETKSSTDIIYNDIKSSLSRVE